MDKTELLSIVNSQLNNAIGAYDSDLDDDKADSLDYYHGRPLGNEVDGRSQVVTRDVFETVEWIKPSILRVFTSGNKVVQFDPVTPDDEDQAEQETDYVNYVITKENDWFIIFHDWSTSSLLEKNAYVKVWFDESENATTETYTGLSDQAFAEVVNRENVEVLEHSENIEVQQLQTEMGQVDQPFITHDIKVRITEKEQKVRIEAIPGEEIKIAKNANKLCLDDAAFVAHECVKTASDLIEMGIDPEVVDNLPGHEERNDETLEYSRRSFEDEDNYEEADRSTREILVSECYIRIDYDDDGIAELRRVLKAGNKILENEEIDFIPIETLCPIPIPHKHVGMSAADPVKDIQEIKSTLMRQMLDNLYLTNNPEKEVLEDEVNLDDLLESVPGGLKRVTQMGSIREITVPFTAGSSLPMLDVLDNMKTTRMGVSRNTMGMDADVLARSTRGAFEGALEQANQRIEMIARIFAETGVKGLFRKVHELLIKNQDQPKVVRLRNKFVEIDPTEWRHRSNMTVTVGLGTGNKDQMLGRLWALAERQGQLVGSPLVTLKNLYNTYEKIIEASDMKDVTRYFTDPETVEQQPKQQQPDINMMMLQLQQQVEQMKAQLKQQEIALKDQREREKMALQHKQKMTELELDHATNVPGAAV